MLAPIVSRQIRHVVSPSCLGRPQLTELPNARNWVYLFLHGRFPAEKMLFGCLCLPAVIRAPTNYTLGNGHQNKKPHRSPSGLRRVELDLAVPALTTNGSGFMTERE